MGTKEGLLLWFINSFKKWLKDNNIEMYSIHNEGKLVVAERFISSTKLQTSVSFMKRRKPMAKILQRLSAGIDPVVFQKISMTIH